MAHPIQKWAQGTTTLILFNSFSGHI
uniref:Uncharacterized protein n=1 Tax=Vitis vinifera TaxID=29760 RepID=F6H2Z7_VITVI